MNVLSLFDGMSCGRIALERAGIEVTNYYASEIDKYAIEVSKKNYPDIIRLGDVLTWPFWDLPKIDLLIGGSPCQGFSFAGKQLNFNDPRSKLFFTFVDCIKAYKSKYFLLENVKMKKEHMQVITDILGVEPILINSALVSAQNRQRLYWTNIPNIGQPKDKGILLKDTIGKNIKFEYHSKRAIAYMNRKAPDGRTKWDFKYHSEIKNKKSACVTANFFKGVPNNVLIAENGIRKFDPIECERLQTVPDNYTEGVSNTQRYKMLGNGWTVDVIVHIFKDLK